MFLQTEQKLTLKEAASRYVSSIIQLLQTARFLHQSIDSGVCVLIKLHGDYASVSE